MTAAPGGGGGVAWPPCSFWSWSLEVYGRDGVAPACLELQDRRGLDVSVLLLCCRLAAQGRALDRAALGRALATSRRWQAEVVRPLRAARRALKAQLASSGPGEPAGAHPELAADLRRRLSALELDAEHIEQLALAAAVDDGGPPATDGARPGPALAAANLALHHAFRPEDRPALRALLAGVFPASAPAEVEAALSSIGV